MPASRSLPEPSFKSERTALVSTLRSVRDRACLPGYVPGLSSAHIGPLIGNTGTLTYHEGGHLARLRPPPGPRKQVGGGRRQHITDFSRASRRRLMNDVYSINFDRIELPYFVTLTYHNEWPSESSGWHGQVKALVKRLERIWGHLMYYWRLEFQERGAPHLHLLLWFEDSSAVVRDPRWRLQRFRNNVAWCWNEIVDPSDMEHLEAGTSVERCKNLRHLTGYLSKYVAKTEQIVPAPAGIGRVWGKWRIHQLPRNPYYAVLTPDQWIKARRAFSRYSGQRIFSPRPRDGEISINGMSAYLSSSTALRLLRWLAGPAPPRPARRPLPARPLDAGRAARHEERSDEAAPPGPRKALAHGASATGASVAGPPNHLAAAERTR